MLKFGYFLRIHVINIEQWFQFLTFQWFINAFILTVGLLFVAGYLQE